MGRVFQWLALWIGAAITGIGALYFGLTAMSDVPSWVVGLSLVLGVVLTATSVLGMAWEAVSALRGPTSARRPITVSVPRDLLPDHGPVPPAALEAEPRPRQFVPASVTPEFLVALFDERTTVQGQQSAQPYLGKWITIRHVVSNVQVFADSAVVSFYIDRPASSVLALYVGAWFAQHHKESVRLLNKGDALAITGRIVEVGRSEIKLEDCELA